MRATAGTARTSCPVRCPSSTPGGAARRRAAIVHLSYSDGLARVSVFEQRGRLDRGRCGGYQRQTRPAAGDRLRPRRRAPAGRLVGGRTVFTVVADAPAAYGGPCGRRAARTARASGKGAMDRLGRGLDRVASGSTRSSERPTDSLGSPADDRRAATGTTSRRPGTAVVGPLAAGRLGAAPRSRATPAPRRGRPPPSGPAAAVRRARWPGRPWRPRGHRGPRPAARRPGPSPDTLGRRAAPRRGGRATPVAGGARRRGRPGRRASPAVPSATCSPSATTAA